MRYLKPYNSFKTNEKLSPSEKRSLKFIPNAILGFLGKKLLGIYPMLNLKWNELKRATKGYKDTIFSTGTPSKVEHELEKITIDKLPPNSLKWAMLLSDWNVYLNKDYKSKGGGEHGNIQRDVIYISKDMISKGDQIRSNRLSDSDIYPDKYFTMSRNKKGKLYPDKLKDPVNFPMIIMVVKYDDLEKVREVEKTISDICLEIEDELPVEVVPYFSKEQDFLNLDIKTENGSYIVYSNNIDLLLTDVAERIKDYMKYEKYIFDYVIKWRVKGPLFYNGSAGRFGTEIIPAAKEYCLKYDTNTENPLWDKYFKKLNIHKLSAELTGNDKLILTSDDMRTLLSDLDNCSKSYTFHFPLEVDTDRSKEFIEKNKVTEIRIEKISISFKKVKNN